MLLSALVGPALASRHHCPRHSRFRLRHCHFSLLELPRGPHKRLHPQRMHPLQFLSLLLERSHGSSQFFTLRVRLSLSRRLGLRSRVTRARADTDDVTARAKQEVRTRRTTWRARRARRHCWNQRPAAHCRGRRASSGGGGRACARASPCWCRWRRRRWRLHQRSDLLSDEARLAEQRQCITRHVQIRTRGRCAAAGTRPRAGTGHSRSGGGGGDGATGGLTTPAQSSQTPNGRAR